MFIDNSRITSNEMVVKYSDLFSDLYHLSANEQLEILINMFSRGVKYAKEDSGHKCSEWERDDDDTP